MKKVHIHFKLAKEIDSSHTHSDILSSLVNESHHEFFLSPMIRKGMFTWTVFVYARGFSRSFSYDVCCLSVSYSLKSAIINLTYSMLFKFYDSTVLAASFFRHILITRRQSASMFFKNSPQFSSQYHFASKCCILSSTDKELRTPFESLCVSVEVLTYSLFIIVFLSHTLGLN